jgi:FkbM family methyltransferase
MPASRISSIARLGRKAVHLAPLVARDPKLLPMMRKGVHPEHFTRLNHSWLREGNIRTVLDIGANTGQFARTMRALLPTATIYAFEPQEECVAEIESRSVRDTRLHTIRTAVGEKDGEITFHRNEFSQSSSILDMSDLHKETFPWATKSNDITVPMHRLDTIQHQLTIDPGVLIKIDVQGYETPVLRGGEQVIRRAQFVLIETSFANLYDGEAGFATVYDLMTTFRFRFAGVLDQFLSPVHGLPLYADALFIRE